MEQCQPILLEPIMNIDGDRARGVHGRCHGRPQQPQGQDRGHELTGASTRSSRPRYPLAEVLTYAASLTSITSGTGHIYHGLLTPRIRCRTISRTRSLRRRRQQKMENDGSEVPSGVCSRRSRPCLSRKSLTLHARPPRRPVQSLSATPTSLSSWQWSNSPKITESEITGHCQLTGR
ncbi:MAG: hypothetical protein MZU91_03135 [Desulfosudis oleivorans]|nr:hypothetical protein [Desulfosudis oleivorans]